MCCSGGKWKREVVPDHKFDFVDTRDYHTKNFGIRLQYVWLYVLVLKSFGVYIADIYTATTMLASDNWTSAIYEKCDIDVCPVNVSFQIGKWVFVGCILFSFLLLAYETRKTKRIIASRDISSAFTNVMANHYYSLRSYDHFCFFCQIENSTKKKDDFAFFVFFTFKDWKRLLLADGPRQTINGLTLYSFWLANGKSNPFENLGDYFSSDDMTTSVLLITMVFTVLIFLGSLLVLVVAGICYIPLLCYIQGNLKEYCCHKVDKRIGELIKKKTQQRVQMEAAQAKKEAATGELSGPQPTLPNFSVDDDDDDKPTLYHSNTGYAKSEYSYWDGKGGQADYAPSLHGANTVVAPGDYGHEYPPMPTYNAANGYGNATHAQFGSQGGHGYDYDEYHGYAGKPAPAESLYDERSEHGNVNGNGVGSHGGYQLEDRPAYDQHAYPQHQQPPPDHGRDAYQPSGDGKGGGYHAY